LIKSDSTFNIVATYLCLKTVTEGHGVISIGTCCFKLDLCL